MKFGASTLVLTIAILAAGLAAACAEQPAPRPPRITVVAATATLAPESARSAPAESPSPAQEQAPPAPSAPPKLTLQPTKQTIGAGSDHICALRADGTARCWGRNGSPPSGVTFALP